MVPVHQNPLYSGISSCFTVTGSFLMPYECFNPLFPKTMFLPLPSTLHFFSPALTTARSPGKLYEID